MAHTFLETGREQEGAFAALCKGQKQGGSRSWPTGGGEVLGDEDGDERGGGCLAVGAGDPVAQLEGVAEGTLRGVVAACGQAAQVVVPQLLQQEAALRRPRHQRPHRPHPANNAHASSAFFSGTHSSLDLLGSNFSGAHR